MYTVNLLYRLTPFFHKSAYASLSECAKISLGHNAHPKPLFIFNLLKIAVSALPYFIKLLNGAVLLTKPSAELGYRVAVKRSEHRLIENVVSVKCRKAFVCLGGLFVVLADKLVDLGMKVVEEAKTVLPPIRENPREWLGGTPFS